MDNQIQQRRELLQALAVLCELLGMVLSEPAARTLVDDLGAYEHAAVMAASAMDRCAPLRAVCSRRLSDSAARLVGAGAGDRRKL